MPSPMNAKPPNYDRHKIISCRHLMWTRPENIHTETGSETLSISPTSVHHDQPRIDQGLERSQGQEVGICSCRQVLFMRLRTDIEA